MSSLNPRWVEIVLDQVNRCPYFALQSMQILELTPGHARMEIDLERKHLQPFGLVHGGVFSSLIDAAGFWAAFTETPDHTGMTTVELKVNYLAPATTGRLIGLGRTIKTGRTLHLAEARVEDDTGRLLSHGTVTLMTLPDLPLVDLDNLPPKFL